jgi:hypothetical protein
VQGGPGSFGLSGQLIAGCPSFYIGGFYGASGGTGSHAVSFGGVPDFSLGNANQLAVLNSTNPLGTSLNGSHYVDDTGDITFFTYGDSH